MGTKKDLEELKKSVEFMGLQMETMANKQDTLMDLMKEMKELRKLNEEKDVMIAQLEGRISDLEQYTRMNDIIVTGIKTRPRSFANAVRNRAVEEGADRSTQEFVSVEQQVVEYLKNKGMDINSVNIEACHPLPQVDKDKPASIILRFANRKSKTVYDGKDGCLRDQMFI